MLTMRKKIRLSHFTDKLPKGWISNSYQVDESIHTIWDEDGVFVANCKVDSMIPLDRHLSYLYKRYYETLPTIDIVDPSMA